MNGYFSECQTLDEAKLLFRKLCFQLHPDHGGDAKEFTRMQNDFDRFRPTKEKFEGEFESWDSSEYASIILQLMELPGLEIEVCGSFVWVGGDTKSVRQQIKAIEPGKSMNRARWSGKKEKWYFSPRDYFKRSRRELDMDEIRNLYGVQQHAKSKRKPVITRS